MWARHKQNMKRKHKRPRCPECMGGMQALYFNLSHGNDRKYIKSGCWLCRKCGIIRLADDLLRGVRIGYEYKGSKK